MIILTPNGTLLDEPFDAVGAARAASKPTTFLLTTKTEQAREKSRTGTGLLDGGLPPGDTDGGWKRPEPGLGLRFDYLLVKIDQEAQCAISFVVGRCPRVHWPWI